ncbi:FMN-dependent L-lactate dehydrogenase LldD [Croceicoccus sp. YJ47]|uniref:FMN-dependent L-lactate dehydrogenase LldD n=1 Tax=Croceicoccus sp. YJ47 TaxID=2798724 RepID=UPI001923B5F8|nr:FMN-dependent L-lactate dehydrogenase LldD [Croceicoccus sp. YJ47]QQN74345.1 FMN-dependent L-lactate dehydrogenase LldD [Croceicoccus sp. YJ47]
MIAASVTDYRELSRRKVPHFLFEYIDGGSYGEVTLRRNTSDLAQIALRQRILRDVSRIDLSTQLFGQMLSMPLALAPIGLAGLNARRGECQAVRAAESAGVPFTLSTVSACSMEEVAAAASRPIWFQLYMLRDRGFMREMIQRAKAVDCPVMMFTVDLPLPGSRYRDVRSGLSGADNLKGAMRRTWQVLKRPRWAWDVGVMGRPLSLGNVAGVMGADAPISDFLAWLGSNFDPSVTWQTLDFIRSEWDRPLVIKGILDPDDAREAVKLGADGIVVSNHGGRQLDGALSVARALPPIADAVRGDMTVLADGGVRSGLDVVRMLALGANGVLIGRPWVYALGGRGEAGVRHVLHLIEAEMRVAMALTGTTSIDQIDRTVLARGGDS